MNECERVLIILRYEETVEMGLMIDGFERFRFLGNYHNANHYFGIFCVTKLLFTDGAV